MEPFLQITDITKTFPGVQALKRVDVNAYEGEALALVGANGAGKSTLVEQLALQMRDSSLKVSIVAVDPTSPFSGGALLGEREPRAQRS